MLELRICGLVSLCYWVRLRGLVVMFDISVMFVLLVLYCFVLRWLFL